MVNHLAKTPLLAVIYAAMLNFIAVFIPRSPAYQSMVSGFDMPINGYLFMMAYGFFLAVILAVLFSAAKSQGFKLTALLLVPVLFTQCAVPLLQPVVFGETTGAMTRSDLLFEFALSAGAIIFTMLMSSLLFKQKPQAKPAGPPKPPVTYKIKKLDLAIKMLVLPIVYCLIYFLAWYFLLWRSEAARVYYSGNPELKTFIAEIINMLLTNARLVPLALIKGLLLALCLIPLLKELEANRVMFIIVSVLLLMGQAVRMLIPSPTMPFDVRFAHMIELLVTAAIYGGLTGFLMHISLLRKVPQHVQAPAKAANPKAEAKPAKAADPEKAEAKSAAAK